MCGKVFFLVCVYCFECLVESSGPSYLGSSVSDLVVCFKVRQTWWFVSRSRCPV